MSCKSSSNFPIIGLTLKDKILHGWNYPQKGSRDQIYTK